MNWILATDLKPRVNQRVLIVYNKGERLTMGFYHPPKTVESDCENEMDDEYDEETDCYYYKEGWVSNCAESEYIYPIHNVVYWAPLPVLP